MKEKWLLKIFYDWKDGTFDEEPDMKFDSAEEAYEKAKQLALIETREASIGQECDIILRFYEGNMCAEVGCSDAYAVIDLTYTYDGGVCRYIVVKG